MWSLPNITGTDIFLGVGVFLVEYLKLFGAFFEKVPFPNFVGCALAGALILLINSFVMGTGVTSMTWKDYLWVGAFAGIGCLIGAFFTTFPILAPIGGGLGAVIGYQKMVLGTW